MKSSLRKKKRIKEDARHLPPKRRWFSLSATALSHCETLHCYTCCARVAAASSSAGHFSEEIKTSHVAARVPQAALYATFSCKARSPISHFQAEYYTKENLHSALAGTPPLSKEGMPKGHLPWASICPEAKLPWRYGLVLSCLPN